MQTGTVLLLGSNTLVLDWIQIPTFIHILHISLFQHKILLASVIALSLETKHGPETLASPEWLTCNMISERINLFFHT